MSRLTVPSREESHKDTHVMLDTIGKRLGFVPNSHRLLSISPKALAGWFALQDSLRQTLDAKTREGNRICESLGRKERERR
jgi:hypothetical protein